MTFAGIVRLGEEQCGYTPARPIDKKTLFTFRKVAGGGVYGDEKEDACGWREH